MIDAVNPRVELPAGLVETRAIVLLPGCTLDEAVAPVEVLIEEGLPILSLSPGQRLTPSMLRRVFGRRLLVGTHDLRTPADAQWAVSEQAAFALTLGDDDQLRSELAAAQIPSARPRSLRPRSPTPGSNRMRPRSRSSRLEYSARATRRSWQPCCPTSQCWPAGPSRCTRSRPGWVPVRWRCAWPTGSSGTPCIAAI